MNVRTIRGISISFYFKNLKKKAAEKPNPHHSFAKYLFQIHLRPDYNKKKKTNTSINHQCMHFSYSFSIHKCLKSSSHIIDDHIT